MCGHRLARVHDSWEPARVVNVKKVYSMLQLCKANCMFWSKHEGDVQSLMPNEFYGFIGIEKCKNHNNTTNVSNIF